MNNLQKTILKKINAGEIDMKPKWHFVLRAGLLLSGLVIVLLLTLYLLSFVFFFLRQSGIAFAPGFGFRGISFFIMSSPWLLIGASITFLLILYFLIQRYSFSFRRPLLYTMFGVILFSLLGAWLIQRTPIHERVGRFAELHEVPMFSPLYRDALSERPVGVVVGAITDITDTGFLLTSEQNEHITIITTDKTRLRRGLQLNVQDRVMVFGDRNGDTVTAFGIRPHRGDMRFSRERREQRELRSLPEKPPDT